jgi:hypothetical protein
MLRMIDLRDIDSDPLLLVRTRQIRNHGASSGARRGLGVLKIADNRLLENQRGGDAGGGDLRTASMPGSVNV